MSGVIKNIITDYPIPIIIGVLVLLAYRSRPEMFPRRLTPAYVVFLALAVIIGSVLLAIWDTYRQSR